MWVYQQSALPESALSDSGTNLPVLAESSPGEHLDASITKTNEDTHAPSATIKTAETPRSDFSRKFSRFSPADCWMLAGAFLIGSAAAGALQAFSDANSTEWLRHYLTVWLGMFTVSEAHPPAMLFGVEYLTLLASATILLLLGFSAFGPVLIFLFTMLYGAGSGMLLCALFCSSGQSVRVLMVFILTAIPASIAAACLCILGTSALRVSSRIRTYSLGTGGAGDSRPRIKALWGQYLLTLAVFLPLCGAATGLAYLECSLI